MKLVLALCLIAACSDERGRGPDATDSDARPTWTLEDVQPQSPRASQTYGLDTFAGKIVVVTLVEGF